MTSSGWNRRIAHALTATVMAAGLALSVTQDAQAQSWWPFANEAPRQKEQNNRPPPVPIPPAPMQQAPPPGQRQSGAGGPVCFQLEQRLVLENQRGSQGRSQLPRLDDDMRQTERALAQAQQQLDRGDCYEIFFFSKSLRRTPQCIQAANQLDSSKRRLSELSIQRQQLQGTSERTYQDDIIRELARNGCGNQYVAEARKRDASDGSIFGSFGSEDDSPKSENSFGSLPYATYRTVCVRTCDGFFFPVSFSTLPSHFARDAEQCQSRCAAPVELYYHQNPGADIRQAVSAKNQTPYTNLKSAFKYTKEYVAGCSCKEAEFVPAAGEKRADVPAPGSVAVAAGTSARGIAKSP